MRITESNIAMASMHHESSFTYKESMTMEVAASKDVAGAILTLSGEAAGKSYKESMAEYKKMQQEEAEKKREENQARFMQQMSDRMHTENKNQFDFPDEYDMKIKMLRHVLAALRGERIEDAVKREPKMDSKLLDLRSARYRKLEAASLQLKSASSVSLGAVSVGTTGVGTTWQRITATSGTFSEAESTTFASTGIVKTADGRSLDFNIEVSMSRAFTSQIDCLEVKEYIKTDPLMINLDTNIGTVSDQKFFFDLDSDGNAEEISFAGQGSGFLALDENGDGKIENGSELFGTKSGDGFRDLAAYDEDGNGWIDENDSVFARLKVWTKDENGKDYLLDLRQSDVGAIYLGNADTQFSLKDDDHNLNAEIKKTGIYLKESTGAVGTLNHVDLAL